LLNQNISYNTIDLPEIGSVAISISSRSKRIQIKIKNGNAILSIPHRKALHDGIAFLQSKQTWVKKKISQSQAKQYKEGLLPYLNYTILLKNTNVKSISTIVSKNTIQIGAPAYLRIESAEVQNAIKKGIDFALSIEAKKYLLQRTQELAELHCLTFENIKISKAKTRWGSCSSTNNINLSQSLMLLPKNLIDYVIIHELCHTVHKNHSKTFWQLVEQKMPAYKQAHSELKKYSTLY